MAWASGRHWLDFDHTTNNHHFPNLWYFSYIFGHFFCQRWIYTKSKMTMHITAVYGLLGHLGATDSDWDHSTNEQPGLGLSLLRSFTCYTPQFPWGWVCTCFCLYLSFLLLQYSLGTFPVRTFVSMPLYHCVFVFCVLFVCVFVFAFAKAHLYFSFNSYIYCHLSLFWGFCIFTFYRNQVRS